MVPKLGPCQLSEQSHATFHTQQGLAPCCRPSHQLPQERKLKLRKPFTVHESQGEKGTVPGTGTGSGTARPEAEASTERLLPRVTRPSARRLSRDKLSHRHDHRMASSLILWFLSLECGS